MAGGVNGRELLPIVYDPASENSLFRYYSQKLLVEDDVRLRRIASNTGQMSHIWQTETHAGGVSAAACGARQAFRWQKRVGWRCLANNLAGRCSISQISEICVHILVFAFQNIQPIGTIERLDMQPRIDRDEEGNVKRIWVSAIHKQGMELIHQVLADYFRQDLVKGVLCLSPADGRIRA